MSGNLLLLFLLFFVGLVATTTSLMRAQRQSRELEAQRAKAIQAKVSQMRQETEEDVTTFGEALRDLDMEMVGKDISADGRKDWNMALDCYDRAKTLMAQDKSTRSIPLVTETLEEGRHAIACVQARANGEPIPEVRPPCFFDPAHGPSTTDVMYSPDGGVARKVPACAADAQRIQQGRSPWIRTVDVNGAQLPYWQAGPDYAPCVQGYYRRYESDPVISGLAVGGLGLVGLGLFSALFDDF